MWEKVHPPSEERGDLVSEDPRRGDTFDEGDDFEEGMTFDELSRELAAGNITRGRALKLFGASVVAALLPAGVAEAATRRRRRKCRKLGQRCGKRFGKCCRGKVCVKQPNGKKRCERRPKKTTTTTTTTRAPTTTTTTAAPTTTTTTAAPTTTTTTTAQPTTTTTTTT
jgi:hypothetical protein